MLSSVINAVVRETSSTQEGEELAISADNYENPVVAQSLVNGQSNM